jgi:hypothetical protein
MNLLAVNFEQVQGFGIAVAVLAAFCLGAWAIGALKEWDKRRCWANTTSRREAEMTEALKASRLERDTAKTELSKLQAAVKGSKPASEFEREVAARKAANTENNELKRELKSQREETTEAGQECWQLKCELNALKGVSTGPLQGPNDEHYERRNGSGRVPLQDFNRSR